MKAAGSLPESGELRQVNYLNTRVEHDHRGIKRVVKPGLGCFSCKAAWRTLHGYEVMHMIRTGQVHGVGTGERSRQVRFIASLLGVAS